jgi:hypothetical protein
MSGRPSILVWSLILGGIGFLLGLVGPMVLDPESEMGPMVGIVLTGPGGVLAGLALGAFFRESGVSDAARRWILTFSALAMAVVTLYVSLPEPAWDSYVVEATVESCEQPTAALDRALADWEPAVERMTWVTPTPNWQALAIRNVQQDNGSLLTLHVQRRIEIRRHRRPWDHGRLSAGAWVAFDERARYYAPAEAGSCESYLQRGTALYWPVVDRGYDPWVPGTAWPPQDVSHFLQLQTLAAVPPDYRQLLP